MRSSAFGTEMRVLENSRVSCDSRIAMIERANHFFVHSGSYGGGEIFSDMLRALIGKLETKPDFMALIIVSEKFITRENSELLDDLVARFPGRFQLLETEDAKLSLCGTQFVKTEPCCSVLEWVKLAKSLPTPEWVGQVMAGMSALSMPEGLKQAANQCRSTTTQAVSQTLSMMARTAYCLTPALLKSMCMVGRDHLYGCMSGVANVHSNHAKLTVTDQAFMIGDSGQEHKFYTSGDEDASNVQLPRENRDGFLAGFIARLFKGMDFLSDDARAGLKLMYLLLEIAKQHADVCGESTRDGFKQWAIGFNRHLHRIDYASITTKDARDERDESKVTVFMDTPKKRERNFESALCRLFDNAKESIVISHMYFHPSSRVYTSLQAALKRGVQVTVQTNAHVGGSSPRGHAFFAPRSIHNLKQLKESCPEAQANLSMHFFNVSGVTLHHKVVSVDHRYVMSGSHNLGDKSQITCADNEISAVFDDPELALTTEAKIFASIEGNTADAETDVGENAASAALHTAIGGYMFG